MAGTPSSFRLPIVDFLGVLLPGLTWFVLLLCTNMYLKWLFEGPPLPEAFSPVQVVIELAVDADQAVTHNVTLSQSPLLLSIVIAVSYVLGRISKAFSMRISESICFPEALLHRNRDLRFPYNAKHKDKAYFRMLTSAVRKYCGADWTDLPSTQPIVACYRILNALSPPLWAQVQTREAECRLTGSLFLCFLYSSALATAVLASRGSSYTTIVWLVGSSFCAGILARAFRIVRQREVEYMYIDTLLAAHIHLNALPKRR